MAVRRQHITIECDAAKDAIHTMGIVPSDILPDTRQDNAAIAVKDILAGSPVVLKGKPLGHTAFDIPGIVTRYLVCKWLILCSGSSVCVRASEEGSTFAIVGSVLRYCPTRYCIWGASLQQEGVADI